jgi:hypothetical protein
MIQLSKSYFEIELLDDNSPQGFWGSRLRGIYGHYLKRTLCLHPSKDRCEGCQLPESCSYTALFEPIQASKGRRLPPPYIFIPPPAGGSNLEQFASGTILGFELITFGPYSHDITHAVEAFRNGHIDNRARFALRSVRDQFAPQKQIDIFADQHTVSSLNILEHITPSLWGADRQQLSVTFLTNTRVENQYARIKDSRTGLTIFSDFYDLVYNLLLRFGGLWELYGTDWPGRNEFKTGFNYHLNAARSIEVIELSLEMNRLLRRSSRKMARLPIDGFTGKMVFFGNTSLFAPLLRIGELLGVGNHTNIGLGRFSIEV